MSYEDEVFLRYTREIGLILILQQDLREANKHVKHGNALAGRYRAPSPHLVSRIAGLVWDNSSSGVGFIKSMTPLQRHAELLYAETLFAKVRTCFMVLVKRTEFTFRSSVAKHRRCWVLSPLEAG